MEILIIKINFRHKNLISIYVKILLIFLEEKIFIFTSRKQLRIWKKKSPNREEDKCKPISFYGKSKLKSTEYLKKSGLNFIVLRLYQIYGPFQKIIELYHLQFIILKNQKVLTLLQVFN